MAVAVIKSDRMNRKKEEKKNPLDDVLQALQLANQAYGIYANVEKLDMAKQSFESEGEQRQAQMQRAEEKAMQENQAFAQGQETLARQKQGIVLPSEIAQYAGRVSTKPAEGAAPLTLRTPEGDQKIYIKGKQEGQLTPYQQIQLQNQQSERTEKRVETLGKNLDKSGIPELVTSLKNIDAYIEKATGKNLDAVTGQDDLPGYGVAGQYAPGLFVGETGRGLRQEVSGLKNALIKARSGGAVTPDEFKRLDAELSGAGTEQELITAIRKIRDVSSTKLRNFETVDPKAVELFRERGGIASTDPIFGARKTEQEIMAEVEYGGKTLKDRKSIQQAALEELNRRQQKAMR